MPEPRRPEEELVPVMVPRSLLGAVYGFIAAQSGEEAASVESEPALHRGWTESMILEAYEAASDRMHVLLDLLAAKAGTRLSIEDFMRVVGADSPDIVNGVLGAFGRLTSQRFSSRLPNRTNSWPFSVSKDVRDGRWYYEMPENVAEVIKTIPR
jgi:hypothetical protein